MVFHCYRVQIIEPKVILLADSHPPWPQSNGQSAAVIPMTSKDRSAWPKVLKPHGVLQKKKQQHTGICNVTYKMLKLQCESLQIRGTIKSQQQDRKCKVLKQLWNAMSSICLSVRAGGEIDASEEPNDPLHFLGKEMGFFSPLRAAYIQATLAGSHSLFGVSFLLLKKLVSAFQWIRRFIACSVQARC